MVQAALSFLEKAIGRRRESESALPAREPYRYQRSVDLFVRAARVIPEGIYGHKNPAFLLPGACPYYAERAEGGHYWDVDGNEYVDFLCGYGPVILGHNHPEVERAVIQQMAKGSCFDHPGEPMVQLAERLVDLISVADWAVFAKNGSDVTTWAVRVAREHTGRKKIVMVRGTYHGAHAWCTAYPGGVLPEEKANVLQMGWNRLDELDNFDNLSWENDKICREIDKLVANGMIEFSVSDYNKFVNVLKLTL